MTSRAIMKTASEGLHADQCPFPGITSYDLDQRHSFRGREQETVELARVMLGQRLTVLTAGSGDGKTSLIHAGLVPLLLREGIEVAVAEPGGQAPVAEIGAQLLGRLVPLAAENLGPLKWLRRKLRRASLTEAREALLREQRESVSVGARPADSESLFPAEYWPTQRPLDLLKGGPIRTWLTNADSSDQLLNAAMSAVAKQAGQRPTADWPGIDAPLTEVIRFLERIPAKRECTRPDPTIHPDILKDMVLAQLERAFMLHARQPGYEIVLVVDQFEELFVQFRGAGPAFEGDAASARWQHKDATIALLSEIMQRQDWPIRVILSLRKEHYAELDAALLQGEQGVAYHLDPLHKSQALISLKQLAPVGPRGGKPSKAAIAEWDEFATNAVDLLAAGNEDRWIDATQLSALGWCLFGQPLPAEVGEAVNQALVQQIEPILSLDGADQAGESASGDRRAGPGRHRAPQVATTIAERQEAIDILSQLRISSGTGGGRRLSLPMSALEAPPWRSRPFRRMMIERLREARLIRQDKRNQQDYFEIVHERMIDVIEQLRQRWKNELYVDLDQILDHLRAIFSLDPFRRTPLSREQFATLDANRERLDLSDFAASRIVEALLATPDLWEEGRKGSGGAVDFLTWLAGLVDKDADNVLAMDPSSREGADAIRQRAQLAWQAGELASPALVEAARGCDIGMEKSERTIWLLLSSLFHGRDGEQRLDELIAEL